ncbi:MAG TPA: hypothetical protein VF941_02995 [Clostridia bacterium]
MKKMPEFQTGDKLEFKTEMTFAFSHTINYEWFTYKVHNINTSDNTVILRWIHDENTMPLMSYYIPDLKKIYRNGNLRIKSEAK